jgi:hypothetical protein
VVRSRHRSQGEKESEPAKPGSLFDPLSVGQRVDYASGSVVVQSPRDQRFRWEARVSGTNRESLKTAVAAWYGASKLSRDTFRQRLLDPNTDDETVDRLRNAAKGIVDARTRAQLSAAGEDLATAAQTIGPDRWPRFIGMPSDGVLQPCRTGRSRASSRRVRQARTWLQGPSAWALSC